MTSTEWINDIKIHVIETDQMVVKIAPALGGKITSIFNKPLNKEFLWNNASLPLAKNDPGAEYDPNFWGGVDELIPNDIPETIDGIAYPDHGELWTTSLSADISANSLRVHGRLPLTGLHYSKTLSLENTAPIIHLDYQIKNESGQPRHFLWKLHAAIIISPGDQLLSSAKTAQVVDPQYSRFTNTKPFNWPSLEDQDASVVPVKSNEMDFFYLYDINRSEMQMASANGEHLFSYSYDQKVFPFQWYFASFGGFLDHYTAILEPCTTMPMSVNEAAERNSTAILQPGEMLTTQVRIYAGEKKNYIS